MYCFMRHGKKILISKYIYKSFLLLYYMQRINPSLFFFELLEKVKPLLNIKIWYYGRRKTKGKKRKFKEL